MRTLASFIAAALLSASALAAPPSDASVETLLTLTRAEAMIDSVYGNMEQMMRQGMQQALGDKTLSDEQRRLFDSVPREATRVMREEFNWAKMRPIYVGIYRDSFDQTEINGLIAFYRTPVGQSFIEKMPVVMQKSMVATQTLMVPLMAKMRAAMEKAMAEAKAKAEPQK